MINNIIYITCLHMQGNERFVYLLQYSHFPKVSTPPGGITES